VSFGGGTARAKVAQLASSFFFGGATIRSLVKCKILMQEL